MVAVQHSAVAYILVLGNVHVTPWHIPFDPNVADMRLDGNLRTSPINDSPDAMFLNGHSILETQVLLTELVENIEFLPPPGNIEIIRGAAELMTPM